MKKFTLKAQPRTALGRKVKNLRTQGLLPATIYGKKVKSSSVQVVADEFFKVYNEAGETGLVELVFEKKSTGLPAGRQVLIHNVQLDPVSDTPVHVEFFQVDLKEKVKAKVPVVFIGESPAVSQKQGVLLTLLDEIEVEALPTDLPEKISVDVSGLSAVDQEFKVSDLKVPGEVTVLTDAAIGIVKVGSLVTKEAEAEAKAAEEAAAAAAAEAAPAEGAPAEGAETKPEEAKKEELQPPTEKPQEEKK